MITFSEYKTAVQPVLITEAENKHMTHIQDLLLYKGVNGTREAINVMRAMRDMLAGNTKVPYHTTVKVDGAPAVFIGTDKDGFFVAKKGIFAKTPKVYRTHQDIDDDIPNPDLNSKMKVAFDSFKDSGMKGIYQGDFMFTKEDIKTQNIDGTDWITFQPNTIVYAFKKDSDEAKLIQSAKMGIVWHTKYSGEIGNLSASFNFNHSEIPSPKSVWTMHPNIQDISGTGTMTDAETKVVTSYLSTIGKLFHSVASTTLKELQDNEELARTIETWNNSHVRGGAYITDPKAHAAGLISYINDKFQKEADKKKTEKGKQKQYDKRDELLNFFSEQNKKSLTNLFEMQMLLFQVKLMLVKKLDELNAMKTFLKTKQGSYKVTGHEGYAVSDHEGNVLKLVDQLEFSYANFSPEIAKGWEH